MDKSHESRVDAHFSPSLPFPISCLATGNVKRYMLYDIDLISWLRREQHILGVLVGTLPQAPSQNVFLGIPLELMPEEARLLVARNIAFLVDDRKWHLDAANEGVTVSKHEDYSKEVSKQGSQAAQVAKRVKEAKLETVMKKLNLSRSVIEKQQENAKNTDLQPSSEAEELLFNAKDTLSISPPQQVPPKLEALAVTPTNSGPLQSEHRLSELPKVDLPSFALFELLHNQGYFLSPGLRFGCQYMAYPGDPLRYHSHFLVVASQWNEGIDLIDIIGSGRLATGVKKSYLLGGIQPSHFKESGDQTTRAFSIEWAGM